MKLILSTDPPPPKKKRNAQKSAHEKTCVYLTLV